MKISYFEPLKPHNTFGIDAMAMAYVAVKNDIEISKVLRDTRAPYFVLGGGSNILFTKDIPATVIHNQIKGISIESSDDESVMIKCGGGVVWHELVLWAIERNFGGIENLSLIPGTVGAAPIQNIGAYGVELKDVFIKLDAIRLSTRERFTFLKKGCRFGYRDSIFKKRHKGEFIITQVYLKLSKNPTINTSYGAITKILAEKNIETPTIKDVSDAIIAIRQSKLPDPVVIGNAGSFFKNPVIPKALFDKVIAEHPTMPHYPQEDGTVKVPAGWLIEQCGWKGKQVGNTGAHANQALVLVNYGEATGEEVLALSEEIIKSVFLKFGIGLNREVNVI